MKLYDFKIGSATDRSNTFHVSGRLSDNPSAEQQTQWIIFQFEIDDTTPQKNVNLEEKALKQMSVMIHAVTEEIVRAQYTKARAPEK